MKTLSQTEFLERAKKLLRQTNEKVTNGVNWVSEMNFIYNDKLILRVWWDNNENCYCHRWCTVTNLHLVS